MRLTWGKDESGTVASGTLEGVKPGDLVDAYPESGREFVTVVVEEVTPETTRVRPYRPRSGQWIQPLIVTVVTLAVVAALSC